MSRKFSAVLSFAAGAVFLAASPATLAQSSSSGTISVTGLSVTVDIGSITWQGWNFVGLTESADSTGADDQNANGASSPGGVDVTSSTLYGSGEAIASSTTDDPTGLVLSASSSASLPSGVFRESYPDTLAGADGYFTLSDAATVTITVNLSAQQSLMTDPTGIVFDNEVGFELDVFDSFGNFADPTGLDYDRDRGLGPNGSRTHNRNHTLTEIFALNPGQYDVEMDLFSGQDVIQVPDAANSALLLLGGLGALLLFRRQRALRH